MPETAQHHEPKDSPTKPPSYSTDSQPPFAPSPPPPLTSTKQPGPRLRWHTLIARNISQVLLTLAGLIMGACAIALLIEEQRTPGTQLHRSVAAIVLLIIWFAAQATYIVLFCIRISTMPTALAALPPAAHYVLRTLTGVLVFIMLPITLAHLSKDGPVAEDFAVYLPFVMSLSAFLNSLMGNPSQMMAAGTTGPFRGYNVQTYGSMGHGCCCFVRGGATRPPGAASRILDDCVDGTVNGVVGSVV